MDCLQVDFDDLRSRNIFVSLLQKSGGDIKIYHKSHTTYQRLFLVGLSDERLEGLQAGYEQRRQKFMKHVSSLVLHLIETLPMETGDLSGEDFVKISFPSPFSYFVIRHILSLKNITIKETSPTSSTAIIGVYDEQGFNEEFWKGVVKPIVERLEDKIDTIASGYYEGEGETGQK